MKNIAICYFSYYKDKDFLELSLKNLNKAIGGNNVKIYVFDDANSKKPLELDGDFRIIKTHFDRKGNLNGYDCIRGMFNEYVKIYNEFQYDFLIKLDSDCCLNSFAYLDDVADYCKNNNIPLQNISQIGSMFCNLVVYGCCQTFTPNGINLVNNIFNNIEKFDAGEDERIMKKRIELGYNEDKVTSCLLEMSPSVRIDLNKLPNKSINGHINAFENYSNADLTKFASVAFKPNVFGNNYFDCWNREFSLKTMKEFVENGKTPQIKKA